MHYCTVASIPAIGFGAKTGTKFLCRYCAHTNPCTSSEAAKFFALHEREVTCSNERRLNALFAMFTVKKY